MSRTIHWGSTIRPVCIQLKIAGRYTEITEAEEGGTRTFLTCALYARYLWNCCWWGAPLLNSLQFFLLQCTGTSAHINDEWHKEETETNRTHQFTLFRPISSRSFYSIHVSWISSSSCFCSLSFHSLAITQLYSTRVSGGLSIRKWPVLFRRSVPNHNLLHL